MTPQQYIRYLQDQCPQKWFLPSINTHAQNEMMHMTPERLPGVTNRTRQILSSSQLSASASEVMALFIPCAIDPSNAALLIDASKLSDNAKLSLKVSFTFVTDLPLDLTRDDIGLFLQILNLKPALQHFFFSDIPDHPVPTIGGLANGTFDAACLRVPDTDLRIITMDLGCAYVSMTFSSLVGRIITSTALDDLTALSADSLQEVIKSHISKRPGDVTEFTYTLTNALLSSLVSPDLPDLVRPHDDPPLDNDISVALWQGSQTFILAHEYAHLRLSRINHFNDVMLTFYGEKVVALGLEKTSATEAFSDDMAIAFTIGIVQAQVRASALDLDTAVAYWIAPDFCLSCLHTIERAARLIGIESRKSVSASERQRLLRSSFYSLSTERLAELQLADYAAMRDRVVAMARVTEQIMDALFEASIPLLMDSLSSGPATESILKWRSTTSPPLFSSSPRQPASSPESKPTPPASSSREDH